MEGGFLTTALYPQPSKRSPLGPGSTEPGSNCTEGDQRGESDREVPAWVPLLGKKLGANLWQKGSVEGYFNYVQINKQPISIYFLNPSHHDLSYLDHSKSLCDGHLRFPSQ